MEHDPIDDTHLVFPVNGERGATGDLVLGTWRYEEQGMRTVQLSFVAPGRGTLDLELTPEGAVSFAEGLDQHARTIIALNEETR